MVAKEAQFSDGEAHASPAPSDTSVVVAFVNSKSGGKAGPKLHKMLCDALGDDKVVDLAMMKTDENQNPVNALKRFAGTEGLRVLVCGGDGTCRFAFWLGCATFVEANYSSRPVYTECPYATMHVKEVNAHTHTESVKKLRASGCQHNFQHHAFVSMQVRSSRPPRKHVPLGEHTEVVDIHARACAYTCLPICPSPIV
eukprot:74267-Pleurochrysis_carterae.AAC.1